MQRTRTSPIDVAYIWLRYLRKHGRVPRLFRPVRYNEKIQWRKLFDFNPVYTRLSDKFALRDFIAERIGSEYLVPALWLGEDVEAIPFDDLKQPFVIKCTHGNAMNVFIDDPGRVDRPMTKAQLRLWLARDHGRALVEPGHISLQPRIMVEPMLRDANGCPPTEYKFFMFDGRAALVAVRLNIDHFAHSNLFVTPEWKRTPMKTDMPRFVGEMPPRPAFFDEMISLAERVGAGFDHLRVDFLVCDDRIFAGEVSLYPQSGMVPMEPDSYDLWLGEHWRLESPRRRAIAALLGRSASAPAASMPRKLDVPGP